ncbi:MAG: hypothetical protein A2033_07955 [Bacteroidetes bacterium GWA2_31_9]|nr:MAG: hypothetical protein A2033_07955 [Bacteroidetes bacterium GWA2_31_9]
MSDIIQLLPDSVANQIAAGEVIQRPASVVKELVENSIDSGADKVEVFIKEAGRTLIQISDNGSGMSETDARLSFERHATSKIRNINDLFIIRTMGFRGEALASIAAIAQVEMKTKKDNQETGTFIEISDSIVHKQEPCSCSKGTQISVKNLFFNVPARRKFLKSNNTEFRNIMVEFQRIALCRPEVEMTLFHNDTEILHLPKSNLKQRIVNLIGKAINQSLVAIKTETLLGNIYGFVGKPEYARRTSSEQYFFVNGRYMRHPYFYKSVMGCYDKLIQSGFFPGYFIYFDIDPAKIDVNIHPTKTEIKFEDENSINQILIASVREALGKFNIVPSIDFDVLQKVDIPMFTKNTQVKFPKIDVNQDYNPFNKEEKTRTFEKQNVKGWENLYEGFENEKQETPVQSKMNIDIDEKVIEYEEYANVFQLKNKYILCQVKSGLMIIDQKRAFERIVYERLINSLQAHSGTIQQKLYPEMIEFSPEDCLVMDELISVFRGLGFDIHSFGKNTYIINGTPSFTEINEWKEVIESSVEHYKNLKNENENIVFENLASSIAKSTANCFNSKLIPLEMNSIINNLFQCKVPNYTPNGKIIISILNEDEIEKKFK